MVRYFGMFAVIETGGKQYRVQEGDVIKVEKLAGDPGAKLTFDKVLLKGDAEKLSIGTPYVEKSIVEGEVTEQGRDEKKIVFRYHSKTRYRKMKGHRQPFTEVKIAKIK